MNLMSYLAQQGKEEAVENLIRMGGRPEDAIYGYALAGNDAQVESVLAMVESSDKSKLPVCTGQLIKGNARAGYVEKIYALSNYKDYLSDFVVGLAQAGDRDKVTGLLDKNITWFGSAVEGYASANHRDLLSKLIKGTTYYPAAIYHAAHAGHTALVNDLLLQCGIAATDQIAPSLTGSLPDRPASFEELNRYSYLNKAMEGYIAGLHFSDAIALLARGASITLCISELKDSHGLPSKDLYLAFLAHIDDASLREKVLKQMSGYSLVMEQLTITEADLKELDKTIGCMASDHLNYIEAQKKLEEPTDCLETGDISLPYIAETLCNESMVSGAKLSP